jgi:adenylyltransferase/sulfurtransferase
MLSESEIKRYKRHLLLPEMGAVGQLALKNARILVIGAGGLGNAVLPYLAAAGVGTITVVDKDVVDISNLQRQVLFTENDLNKSKSSTIVNRLLQINSTGNYRSINQYFTEGNSVELSENHDVIIDCVDQIEVRYLINDLAIHNKIPMVYGAIHRFEGQVSVFNYKQGATYRCAFPKNENKSVAPSCEEAGVIGVLPGIIGMYQAMETLKIITGIGTVLSNKIMMVDLLYNSNHSIQIEKNNDSISVSKSKVNDILTRKMESEIIDFEGNELEAVIDENQGLKIIDIQYQTNVKSIKGVDVTHIPVSEFEQEIKNLDKSQTVLLYCAHGVNSQWATRLLKRNNFKKIYHLVGGITSV